MRALPALLLPLALLIACAHTPSSREIEAAEIHYDLGVNLMQQGRTQEALKEFMQALEKNPEMPEVHNALGLFYHWSYHRLDEAERHLRRALELRPAFSDASNNLGVLLAEKQDLNGARVAFEAALADPLYTTPHIAQTNLAWVVHLLGNTPGAERLVRSALSTAPAYCAGHRQLARLMEAQDRQAEADVSWERFAEHCPSEPEALLNLAKVQARRGETAQASRSLMGCLEQAGARPIAGECRALLAGLPPVDDAPEPVAPQRRPSGQEAGASVGGARDLDAR